jgi:hypothetical protein
MIAHVILFRPKPELTAAYRRAVLASLAAAAEIPSVRSCRVGRRVRHGHPGYEQAMREDFEYAAILEFDDLDGLTAYLRHPRHADISRYFTDASSAALAYDYTMVDILEGSSLLEA